MDGASNGTLDNEFGTHKDEEVIKVILEKGSLQETEVCLLSVSHIPFHLHFDPLLCPTSLQHRNVC